MNTKFPPAISGSPKHDCRQKTEIKPNFRKSTLKSKLCINLTSKKIQFLYGYELI